MTKQPTVFVVDDDKRVRDSLRWLIESVNLPVETYASAEDFLQACHPHIHGCLILDIRMPRISGLQVQDMLAERSIRLPIIMVSGHGDVPTAVRAVKKGAVDFLEKPFNDQVLLDRIHSVLADELTREQEETESGEFLRRAASLTPREREVLQRVVVGSPNKRIAIELGISVKTVEVHRARAMEKMGAKSLAEVTAQCICCGLYTGKP